MADLDEQLRSLRDSLWALVARLADNESRVNRVTRAYLVCNSRIAKGARGTAEDVEEIRSLAEQLSSFQPTAGNFRKLLDATEAVLNRVKAADAP